MKFAYGKTTKWSETLWTHLLLQQKCFFKPWESCAADIYLFKVNNGIARKSCDICSKLTVKRRH